MPLKEFGFPANRLANIQTQLERLFAQNYYLNKVASYSISHVRKLSVLQGSLGRIQILSPSLYASHSLRSVFDAHKLDLIKVAKSFGFRTPPRVDITLGASMSREQKERGSKSVW